MQPGHGEYFFRDVELPLLDLPDEDLTTLAWLEQTFQPNSPQHNAVTGLLERLRLYLSPERRGQIERQRAALILQLGQQMKTVSRRQRHGTGCWIVRLTLLVQVQVKARDHQAHQGRLTERDYNQPVCRA